MLFLGSYIKLWLYIHYIDMLIFQTNAHNIFSFKPKAKDWDLQLVITNLYIIVYILLSLLIDAYICKCITCILSNDANCICLFLFYWLCIKSWIKIVLNGKSFFVTHFLIHLYSYNFKPFCHVKREKKCTDTMTKVSQNHVVVFSQQQLNNNKKKKEFHDPWPLHLALSSECNI